jgi:hypothetical protein
VSSRRLTGPRHETRLRFRAATHQSQEQCGPYPSNSRAPAAPSPPGTGQFSDGISRACDNYSFAVGDLLQIAGQVTLHFIDIHKLHRSTSIPYKPKCIKPLRFEQSTLRISPTPRPPQSSEKREIFTTKVTKVTKL